MKMPKKSKDRKFRRFKKRTILGKVSTFYQKIMKIKGFVKICVQIRIFLSFTILHFFCVLILIGAELENVSTSR